MYSQYISCSFQQTSGLLNVVARQNNNFCTIIRKVPSVSCYCSILMPPAYFLNHGEIAHCYAFIRMYNICCIFGTTILREASAAIHPDIPTCHFPLFSLLGSSLIKFIDESHLRLDLNDLKDFRSLLFLVVIHQVLIALIIFYHSRFVRYHWTPVSSPLWVACSEIREKAASPSPPAEFRPS